MKNKLVVCIVCIGGILLTAAGCKTGGSGGLQTDDNTIMDTAESQSYKNQTKEAANDDTKEAVMPPANINEHYKKLIDAARQSVASNDADLADKYDFSIQICILNPDYEIPGYLIKDIDGDGTEELIFGSNTVKPDDWDGVIYNIYTISDGEPVQVFEGWDRNTGYFCENGIIENTAAGGAIYTEYNYYTYRNGSLNVVESVIYDGWKDEKNPWFHSTDTEGNKENAAPINEEQAQEIMGKYVRTQTRYIPFGD